MKPRLLDLFCGAGGAAMGYARAGFEVVGVDIAPQKNYPFEFVQANAIEFLIDGGERGYDVIHASPPCQAYSIANNIWQKQHPRYIGIVREQLEDTGLPWIMENVPGATMRNYVVVCGLSLGLSVKRHRLFESNVSLMVPPCHSSHAGDWLLVFGQTVLERGTTIGIAKGGGPVIRRKHTTTARGREAMGIDWMTRDELSESIPPAYTELIGAQLLQHVQALAA